jgi:hypothetical protein
MRLAGLLCLLSCGEPPVQIEDAGIEVVRSLEIGTGSTAYEPLADEQALAIVSGAQGGGRYLGYHLFVGFLARGVAPDGVEVRWAASDEEAELGTAAYRVDLDAIEDGFGAWSMRIILSDCCAAENRRLRIDLSLVDRDGVGEEAHRFVVASECRPGPRYPTIDPCP